MNTELRLNSKMILKKIFQTDEECIFYKNYGKCEKT